MYRRCWIDPPPKHGTKFRKARFSVMSSGPWLALCRPAPRFRSAGARGSSFDASCSSSVSSRSARTPCISRRSTTTTMNYRAANTIRLLHDGTTWFRSSRSTAVDRSSATRSISMPAALPSWFGRGQIGSTVIANAGGARLQRHYDRSTCSWQSRARMVPEQVGIAHVGLLMGGLQSHCLQESRSGDRTFLLAAMS